MSGRSPLWTGLSLLLLAAPGLWAQEPPEAPPSEPPQDEPIELAEEITVTAGHGDRRIQDVRQTRFDPLLLPARAADGRWTVDTWAPLDGFVANGGVRVAF